MKTNIVALYAISVYGTMYLYGIFVYIYMEFQCMVFIWNFSVWYLYGIFVYIYMEFQCMVLTNLN